MYPRNQTFHEKKEKKTNKHGGLHNADYYVVRRLNTK